MQITTDIRVLFGDGTIDQLGALAKELGFSRTLLVADAGLARAGHLEHAHALLERAGIEALEFSDFGPNPDADMLEAGRASSRRARASIRSSDSAAAVRSIARRGSTFC